MRVLLTGASGFVGRRLSRRLLDDGHEVHLILRHGSTADPSWAGNDRARVHRTEGRRGEIDAVVQDAAPHLSFHLASRFVVEHGPDDVEELVKANILFGAQVVDALAAAGTSRLVVAGTSWRHFGPDGHDPVNLYAATKEAFHSLLGFWVASAGLRAVSLELFDTYGPGDPRPKLVPLLLRMAANGETTGFSPGEQKLDLLHVDDVVEAFVVAGRRTAALRATSLESFAVSSGRPMPLREVVREFERALGRPLGVRWGERPYRAREVMSPWAGGEALPGWAPRISLAEGFHELIASLRAG